MADIKLKISAFYCIIVTDYINVVRKINYEIFKKLMVNKYRVDNEIYEDKEFLIQDPDGYLLRFNN